MNHVIATQTVKAAARIPMVKRVPLSITTATVSSVPSTKRNHRKDTMNVAKTKKVKVSTGTNERKPMVNAAIANIGYALA